MSSLASIQGPPELSGHESEVRLHSMLCVFLQFLRAVEVKVQRKQGAGFNQIW